MSTSTDAPAAPPSDIERWPEFAGPGSETEAGALSYGVPDTRTFNADQSYKPRLAQRPGDPVNMDRSASDAPPNAALSDLQAAVDRARAAGIPVR